MEIFRTTSKIELTQWTDKKRVFLELSPALAGNAKGQPKAGEQRFDYAKKIRISFKVLEMFQAAYNFLGLAHGAELEYKKFADMSKSVAEGDEQKQLVIKGYQGKVSINITNGTDKVGIVITPEESYALGKWFEAQATRFSLLMADEEEAKRDAAAKASQN